MQQSTWNGPPNSVDDKDVKQNTTLLSSFLTMDPKYGSIRVSCLFARFALYLARYRLIADFYVLINVRRT